jgi:hypothetical protein
MILMPWALPVPAESGMIFLLTLILIFKPLDATQQLIEGLGSARFRE